MRANLFGVLIAAAGIAMLMFGALSPSWWTVSQGDVQIGMGLHGIEGCKAGVCERVSYEAIGTQEDKSFVMAGNIAYYGAFVTGGLLALVVVLAMFGTSIGGAIAPSRIAAVLALLMAIAAVAFVFLRPSTAGVGLHTARATYLYFGGTVAAMIGSVALTPSSA